MRHRDRSLTTRSAVARASSAQCVAVPVDEIADGDDYSSEVSFRISEQDLDAYRRAADYWNFSKVDVTQRRVVMTERSRETMCETYAAPDSNVDLIAHDIPDSPYADPSEFKGEFGVEDKKVSLAFGLLSPNKGIEYVLKAIPEVTREFPDFVYRVLVATHPSLVRSEGERYRISTGDPVASRTVMLADHRGCRGCSFPG